MKYRLLVLNAETGRELVFHVAISDREAVEETGAGWLRRFPDDIVMLVDA